MSIAASAERITVLNWLLILMNTLFYTLTNDLFWAFMNKWWFQRVKCENLLVFSYSFQCKLNNYGTCGRKEQVNRFGFLSSHLAAHTGCCVPGWGRLLRLFLTPAALLALCTRTLWTRETTLEVSITYEGITKINIDLELTDILRTESVLAIKDKHCDLILSHVSFKNKSDYTLSQKIKSRFLCTRPGLSWLQTQGFSHISASW